MSKLSLVLSSFAAFFCGLLFFGAFLISPVNAQQPLSLPPACNNFTAEDLRPGKLVGSADLCDQDENGQPKVQTVCHTKLYGDLVLCDFSTQISGEAPEGGCEEPDPNNLRAPNSGDPEDCGNGYQSCQIAGSSLPFCEKRRDVLETGGNAAQIEFSNSGGTPPEAKPPAPPSVGLGGGPAGLKQLQEILTRVINISVALAFIALTVVLVYAGIKYLTSGGEQKALALAHQAVTWALMGILFLAIAWLILKLIAVFTGVDVTQFCLGFAGATTGCS